MIVTNTVWSLQTLEMYPYVYNQIGTYQQNNMDKQIYCDLNKRFFFCCTLRLNFALLF